MGILPSRPHFDRRCVFNFHYPNSDYTITALFVIGDMRTLLKGMCCARENSKILYFKI